MSEAKPAWSFKGLGFSFLFSIGFMALWCFWGALAFPLLHAMDLLSEACFIPYVPGSYIRLSSFEQWAPHVSLLGLASVPIRNVPNSFIAFFWVMALSMQIYTWFAYNLPGLPKCSRKGKTRQQLLREIVIAKFRLFAMYSVIFGLLSLPGLMSYEILQGGALRDKGYFGFTENSRALVDLREIRRYTYGRGNSLIAWDLKFRNGDVYTFQGAPARPALEYLLALPGVNSNVAVKDGRFVLKPE